MKNPWVPASTLALGPGFMAMLVLPSEHFTSIAINRSFSLVKHNLQIYKNLRIDSIQAKQIHSTLCYKNSDIK